MINRTILFDNMQEESVIDASINNQFGFTLTDQGEVWKFGDFSATGVTQNSQKGQSEFLSKQFLNQPPQKFLGNSKEQIIQISCNNSAILCLTHNGLVYSCGYDPNGYGFLGFGDTQTISNPMLIPYLEKKMIKCISLGQQHAGAIDHMGKLYLWGTGTHGEIGTKEKTCIKTPALVQLRELMSNKQITCRGNLTTIITMGGYIYFLGIIGQGNNEFFETVLSNQKQPIEEEDGLVKKLAGDLEKMMYTKAIVLSEGVAALTRTGQVFIINKYFEAQVILIDREVSALAISKSKLCCLTSNKVMIQIDFFSLWKHPFCLQSNNAHYGTASRPLDADTLSIQLFPLADDYKSCKFINGHNSKMAGLSYQTVVVNTENSSVNPEQFKTRKARIDSFNIKKVQGDMYFSPKIQSTTAANYSFQKSKNSNSNDTSNLASKRGGQNDSFTNVQHGTGHSNHISGNMGETSSSSSPYFTKLSNIKKQFGLNQSQTQIHPSATGASKGLDNFIEEYSQKLNNMNASSTTLESNGQLSHIQSQSNSSHNKPLSHSIFQSLSNNTSENNNHSKSNRGPLDRITQTPTSHNNTNDSHVHMQHLGGDQYKNFQKINDNKKNFLDEIFSSTTRVKTNEGLNSSKFVPYHQHNQLHHVNVKGSLHQQLETKINLPRKNQNRSNDSQYQQDISQISEINFNAGHQNMMEDDFHNEQVIGDQTGNQQILAASNLLGEGGVESSNLQKNLQSLSIMQRKELMRDQVLGLEHVNNFKQRAERIRENLVRQQIDSHINYSRRENSLAINNSRVSPRRNGPVSASAKIPNQIISRDLYEEVFKISESNFGLQNFSENFNPGSNRANSPKSQSNNYHNVNDQILTSEYNENGRVSRKDNRKSKTSEHTDQMATPREETGSNSHNTLNNNSNLNDSRNQMKAFVQTELQTEDKEDQMKKNLERKNSFLERWEQISAGVEESADIEVSDDNQSNQHQPARVSQFNRKSINSSLNQTKNSEDALTIQDFSAMRNLLKDPMNRKHFLGQPLQYFIDLIFMEKSNSEKQSLSGSMVEELELIKRAILDNNFSNPNGQKPKEKAIDREKLKEKKQQIEEIQEIDENDNELLPQKQDKTHKDQTKTFIPDDSHATFGHNDSFLKSSPLQFEKTKQNLQEQTNLALESDFQKFDKRKYKEQLNRKYAEVITPLEDLHEQIQNNADMSDSQDNSSKPPESGDRLNGSSRGKQLNNSRENSVSNNASRSSSYGAQNQQRVERLKEKIQNMKKGSISNISMDKRRLMSQDEESEIKSLSNQENIDKRRITIDSDNEKGKEKNSDFNDQRSNSSPPNDREPKNIFLKKGLKSGNSSRSDLGGDRDSQKQMPLDSFTEEDSQIQYPNSQFRESEIRQKFFNEQSSIHSQDNRREDSDTLYSGDSQIQRIDSTKNRITNSQSEQNFAQNSPTSHNNSVADPYQINDIRQSSMKESKTQEKPEKSSQTQEDKLSSKKSDRGTEKQRENSFSNIVSEDNTPTAKNSNQAAQSLLIIKPNSDKLSHIDAESPQFYNERRINSDSDSSNPLNKPKSFLGNRAAKEDQKDSNSNSEGFLEKANQLRQSAGFSLEQQGSEQQKENEQPNNKIEQENKKIGKNEESAAQRLGQIVETETGSKQSQITEERLNTISEGKNSDGSMSENQIQLPRNKEELSKNGQNQFSDNVQEDQVDQQGQSSGRENKQTKANTQESQKKDQEKQQKDIERDSNSNDNDTESNSEQFQKTDSSLEEISSQKESQKSKKQSETKHSKTKQQERIQQSQVNQHKKPKIEKEESAQDSRENSNELEIDQEQESVDVQPSSGSESEVQEQIQVEEVKNNKKPKKEEKQKESRVPAEKPQNITEQSEKVKGNLRDSEKLSVPSDDQQKSKHRKSEEKVQNKKDSKSKSSKGQMMIEQSEERNSTVSSQYENSDEQIKFSSLQVSSHDNEEASHSDEYQEKQNQVNKKKVQKVQKRKTVEPEESNSDQSREQNSENNSNSQSSQRNYEVNQKSNKTSDKQSHDSQKNVTASSKKPSDKKESANSKSSSKQRNSIQSERDDSSQLEEKIIEKSSSQSRKDSSGKKTQISNDNRKSSYEQKRSDHQESRRQNNSVDSQIQSSNNPFRDRSDSNDNRSDRFQQSQNEEEAIQNNSGIMKNSSTFGQPPTGRSKTSFSGSNALINSPVQQSMNDQQTQIQDQFFPNNTNQSHTDESFKEDYSQKGEPLRAEDLAASSGSKFTKQITPKKEEKATLTSPQKLSENQKNNQTEEQQNEPIQIELQRDEAMRQLPFKSAGTSEKGKSDFSSDLDQFQKPYEPIVGSGQKLDNVLRQDKIRTSLSQQRLRKESPLIRDQGNQTNEDQLTLSISQSMIRQTSRDNAKEQNTSDSHLENIKSDNQDRHQDPIVGSQGRKLDTDHHISGSGSGFKLGEISLDLNKNNISSPPPHGNSLNFSRNYSPYHNSQISPEIGFDKPDFSPIIGGTNFYEESLNSTNNHNNTNIHEKKHNSSPDMKSMVQLPAQNLQQHQQPRDQQFQQQNSRENLNNDSSYQRNSGSMVQIQNSQDNFYQIDKNTQSSLGNTGLSSSAVENNNSLLFNQITSSKSKGEDQKFNNFQFQDVKNVSQSNNENNNFNNNNSNNFNNLQMNRIPTSSSNFQSEKNINSNRSEDMVSPKSQPKNQKINFLEYQEIIASRSSSLAPQDVPGIQQQIRKLPSLQDPASSAQVPPPIGYQTSPYGNFNNNFNTFVISPTTTTQNFQNISIYSEKTPAEKKELISNNSQKDLTFPTSIAQTTKISENQQFNEFSASINAIEYRSPVLPIKDSLLPPSANNDNNYTSLLRESTISNNPNQSSTQFQELEKHVSFIPPTFAYGNSNTQSKNLEQNKASFSTDFKPVDNLKRGYESEKGLNEFQIDQKLFNDKSATSKYESVNSQSNQKLETFYNEILQSPNYQRELNSDIQDLTPSHVNYNSSPGINREHLHNYEIIDGQLQSSSRGNLNIQSRVDRVSLPPHTDKQSNFFGSYEGSGKNSLVFTDSNQPKQQNLTNQYIAQSQSSPSRISNEFQPASVPIMIHDNYFCEFSTEKQISVQPTQSPTNFSSVSKLPQTSPIFPSKQISGFENKDLIAANVVAPQPNSMQSSTFHFDQQIQSENNFQNTRESGIRNPDNTFKIDDKIRFTSIYKDEFRHSSSTDKLSISNNTSIQTSATPSYNQGQRDQEYSLGINYDFPKDNKSLVQTLETGLQTFEAKAQVNSYADQYHKKRDSSLSKADQKLSDEIDQNINNFKNSSDFAQPKSHSAWTSSQDMRQINLPLQMKPAEQYPIVDQLQLQPNLTPYSLPSHIPLPTFSHIGVDNFQLQTTSTLDEDRANSGGTTLPSIERENKFQMTGNLKLYHMEGESTERMGDWKKTENPISPQISSLPSYRMSLDPMYGSFNMNSQQQFPIHQETNEKINLINEKLKEQIQKIDDSLQQVQQVCQSPDSINDTSKHGSSFYLNQKGSVSSQSVYKNRQAGGGLSSSNASFSRNGPQYNGNYGVKINLSNILNEKEQSEKHEQHSISTIPENLKRGDSNSNSDFMISEGTSQEEQKENIYVQDSHHQFYSPGSDFNHFKSHFNMNNTKSDSYVSTFQQINQDSQVSHGKSQSSIHLPLLASTPNQVLRNHKSFENFKKNSKADEQLMKLYRQEYESLTQQIMDRIFISPRQQKSQSIYSQDNSMISQNNQILPRDGFNTSNNNNNNFSYNNNSQQFDLDQKYQSLTPPRDGEINFGSSNQKYQKSSSKTLHEPPTQIADLKIYDSFQRLKTNDQIALVVALKIEKFMIKRKFFVFNHIQSIVFNGNQQKGITLSLSNSRLLNSLEKTRNQINLSQYLLRQSSSPNKNASAHENPSVSGGLQQRNKSVDLSTKGSILLNNFNKITQLHQMEAFYQIQNYAQTRHFMVQQFVQIIENSLSLIKQRLTLNFFYNLKNSQPKNHSSAKKKLNFVYEQSPIKQKAGFNTIHSVPAYYRSQTTEVYEPQIKSNQARAVSSIFYVLNEALLVRKRTFLSQLVDSEKDTMGVQLISLICNNLFKNLETLAIRSKHFAFSKLKETGFYSRRSPDHYSPTNALSPEFSRNNQYNPFIKHQFNYSPSHLDQINQMNKARSSENGGFNNHLQTIYAINPVVGRSQLSSEQKHKFESFGVRIPTMDPSIEEFKNSLELRHEMNMQLGTPDSNFQVDLSLMKNSNSQPHHTSEFLEINRAEEDYNQNKKKLYQIQRIEDQLNERIEANLRLTKQGGNFESPVSQRQTPLPTEQNSIDNREMSRVMAEPKELDTSPQSRNRLAYLREIQDFEKKITNELETISSMNRFNPDINANKLINNNNNNRVSNTNPVQEDRQFRSNHHGYNYQVSNLGIKNISPLDSMYEQNRQSYTQQSNPLQPNKFSMSLSPDYINSVYSAPGSNQLNTSHSKGPSGSSNNRGSFFGSSQANNQVSSSQNNLNLNNNKLQSSFASSVNPNSSNHNNNSNMNPPSHNLPGYDQVIACQKQYIGNKFQNISGIINGQISPKVTPGPSSVGTVSHSGSSGSLIHGTNMPKIIVHIPNGQTNNVIYSQESGLSHLLSPHSNTGPDFERNNYSSFSPNPIPISIIQQNLMTSSSSSSRVRSSLLSSVGNHPFHSQHPHYVSESPMRISQTAYVTSISPTQLYRN